MSTQQLVDTVKQLEQDAQHIIDQDSLFVEAYNTMFRVLQEKVDSLEDHVIRVSTRDILNNICLASRTVCSGVHKLHRTFDSRSQAKHHRSSNLANHDAHWCSVPYAHRAIKLHLRQTIQNFLANARLEQDMEQEEIIQQCTLADVQKMVTSVTPQEYRDMSNFQQQIAESWMNLRAKRGVTDDLLRATDVDEYARYGWSDMTTAMERISKVHPKLSLASEPRSLEDFYFSLRRDVVFLPEDVQPDVHQSWLELCQDARLKMRPPRRSSKKQPSSHLHQCIPAYQSSTFALCTPENPDTAAKCHQAGNRVDINRGPEKRQFSTLARDMRTAELQPKVRNHPLTILGSNPSVRQCATSSRSALLPNLALASRVRPRRILTAQWNFSPKVFRRIFKP